MTWSKENEAVLSGSRVYHPIVRGGGVVEGSAGGDEDNFRIGLAA